MENLNKPEEQSTVEMLTEYASLLWHWSWLLVLLALLAGGASYYLSSRQTPVYQTSALAMINAAPNSQDYTSIYVGQQLAESYSKIMTTRTVLDSVAQRLEMASLPASVKVSPVTNTSLLSVTVTGTDPAQIVLIANTLVTVFSEQIQADQASRYADSKQSLQTQMDVLDKQIQTSSADLAVLGQQINANNTILTDLLGQDTSKLTQEQLDQRASQIAQTQTTLQSQLSQQAELQTGLQNTRSSYSYLLNSFESIRLAESQSSSGVLLKDPAILPGGPIQPQPLRSAMLAAVVGLFIGAGIIFAIEFLDDSLRDPQEITRKWGIPVLAIIAQFDSSNGNQLITQKQPRAPVSEAFRSLRTSLQFASIASPIHTLLVTSPSPEDGKSTIVGNLACVTAQGGRKVVMVDADLRRPQLHKIFQLSNHFGLTDQFIQPEGNVIEDKQQIQREGYIKEDVQQTEIKNLFLLSSGTLPPNPSELISSKKMVDLIQALEVQYEMVVMDAPPVLVVTDANVLANRADGVLLVVSPNTTKRAAIRHTIEQLAQVHAHIIGVVINRADLRKSEYSYYRGSYTKYENRYSSYWKPESRSSGLQKNKRGQQAREHSNKLGQ